MIEGVLEGVAASAIFAAAAYLFTERGLPLIRGHLRRLPKLNRTQWQRKYEDDSSAHPRSVMRIKQSGTRIDALIERSGDKVQRVFKYRGELSGHELVLHWEDIHSPEVVVGAMVLHLSHDLKKLVGQIVHFSQVQGRVINVPCTYERIWTAGE
jgi:hypothetical protein